MEWLHWDPGSFPLWEMLSARTLGGLSLQLGLLGQKICIQARTVPSLSPPQVEIPRHRDRVTVSKGQQLAQAA